MRLSKNLKTAAAALLLLFGTAARADIPPVVVHPSFSNWTSFGAASLFALAGDGLHVTWDSSQTNSYFYYPLGLTLTRSDRFQLTFTLQLSDAQIGTSPDKPATFPIAIGLLNTSTNAFDPAMFRGTGIDPAHGGRNLFEWNYFPDSGFGATIASVIATEQNQIAYAHNFPRELQIGRWYRFEMTFTPADQTLRTRMWEGSDTNNLGPARTVKDLNFASEFADFRVDALAVSSYSDAVQPPPFPGSIRASAVVPEVALTIFDRPSLAIVGPASDLALRFDTIPEWTYHIEQSADALSWQTVAGPFTGTGEPIVVAAPQSGSSALYRVRARRP